MRPATAARAGVDHPEAPLPRGHRVWLLRARGVSWLIRPRAVLVAVGVALTGAVVALLALGTGSFQVSVPDVLRALAGEGPEQIRTLVVDWRLSRVVLALLVGAALGLSGAILQSLTRNPLGSPDVIGFASGAYTGTLIAIIAIGTARSTMVLGGLIGGTVTALTIYLLAYKRGVQGFRLIVVGIAITAMLGSLDTYLLLKTELWQAMMAAVWGAGSLNGLDWLDVRVVAGTLAVVLPVVLALGRHLDIIEMGDDVAAALGIRVERVRVLLYLLGTVLIAVTTVVTGPIAFVALAAPHLARRLAGGTGPQLAASTLLGAALLLVCDYVALHAFDPVVLPAGLVTVVLGGGYLAFLLARETRRELR